VVVYQTQLNMSESKSPQNSAREASKQLLHRHKNPNANVIENNEGLQQGFTGGHSTDAGQEMAKSAARYASFLDVPQVRKVASAVHLVDAVAQKETAKPPGNSPFLDAPQLRQVASASHMVDPINNLRDLDKVRYKPNVHQLAESLKVAVMMRGPSEPLPAYFNTQILHVAESYQRLSQEVDRHRRQNEKMKQERDNAVERLRSWKCDQVGEEVKPSFRIPRLPTSISRQHLCGPVDYDSVMQHRRTSGIDWSTLDTGPEIVTEGGQSTDSESLYGEPAQQPRLMSPEFSVMLDRTKTKEFKEAGEERRLAILELQQTKQAGYRHRSKLSRPLGRQVQQKEAAQQGFVGGKKLQSLSQDHAISRTRFSVLSKKPEDKQNLEARRQKARQRWGVRVQMKDEESSSGSVSTGEDTDLDAAAGPLRFVTKVDEGSVDHKHNEK
jgi:hypothetical protein